MAGFCNSAPRLQAPDSANCEANSQKVSGLHREYSRFREARAGDRVRKSDIPAEIAKAIAEGAPADSDFLICHWLGE